MKKLIFLFVLISLKNFAQYKIEYDYVMETFDSFGTSKTVNKCYLYTDNIQSKFIKDRVINGMLEQEYQYPNSEIHQGFKEERQRDSYGDSIGYVVTKFLEADSIYLRTYPGNLVKEKFDNTYTIVDEYKVILNFNCQKAITKIYDREFIVWFTIAIPLSDGPWKLYGLPGLVIEAHSKDGYHNFYATKIKSIKDIAYLYKSTPYNKVIGINEKYEYSKKFAEKQFKYKKSKNKDSQIKITINELDFPLIHFE